MDKITKQNLSKDKHVLGQAWNKTYKGYFSNKRVINSFIKSLKPYYNKFPKDLKIMYVCSGTGLLGEELVKNLIKKGFDPELTLLDISKKQLKENQNPCTIKINADLVEFKSRTKYDLVIMRSALDYFYEYNLQIKVLKRIKTLLKSNGFFVNQPASAHSIFDKDLLNDVYLSTKKIGHRNFQYFSELSKQHIKAGLEMPNKIGKSKDMAITNNNHEARYKINKKEVENIRELIKSSRYKLNNLKITRLGYKLKFNFPIYICKKLLKD